MAQKYKPENQTESCIGPLTASLLIITEDCKLIPHLKRTNSSSIDTGLKSAIMLIL